MNRDSDHLTLKNSSHVILKPARGGLKDPQKARPNKCGIKAFSPATPEGKLQPATI